jgi:hypothetical protein
MIDHCQGLERRDGSPRVFDNQQPDFAPLCTLIRLFHSIQLQFFMSFHCSGPFESQTSQKGPLVSWVKQWEYDEQCVYARRSCMINFQKDICNAPSPAILPLTRYKYNIFPLGSLLYRTNPSPPTLSMLDILVPIKSAESVGATLDN